MPKIYLETHIHNTMEVCFNLARSIDLHSLSTVQTNEKAIAGRTRGLIEVGKTVTWEAVHFGIKQQLTSKITALEFPYYFVDEQVNGAFKSIYHEHIFEQTKDGVLMRDFFSFESPYGIVGKLFNVFVLKLYMKRFLQRRNEVIKLYAESEKWKEVLLINN